MDQFHDTLARVSGLITSIVPVIILAMLGGVVRSVQAGSYGLRAVLFAAISAGFTGVIMSLLLQHSGLPNGVQAALVGVSGYASGEILKILAYRLCRMVRHKE